MHHYFARAVDRAQHAVSVARDLMGVARELAGWSRELRERMAEEHNAVREISRSGSYRQ